MRRRSVGPLSDRDRQVLRFVAQVGVAGAQQIEQLAFPAGADSETSALSAARRARRALQRLHDDGYLLRLERRCGGARAGSAGWLYQLGTRGRRALGLTGRGRTWQPGSRYLDHALATGQLHVDLVSAEREGRISDLRITHEPTTWRRFSTAAGLVTLKPDLLVELTTQDGWELRWWVEIDRSTEHLPTVLGKCQRYEQYWRSGREAAHHEVFPRVAWSVPDPPRAAALARAISGSRRLSDELFAVATTEQTLALLITSNQPEGGHP